MNYASIKYCDIANGVGVRTTLFVSGCRRHCKECFNPEAWSLESGEPFTHEVEDQIIDSMRPSYIAGLTLLGGEPFEPENQRGLVDFVERVRAELPAKSIWAFSGFTWPELVGVEAPHAPYTVSPAIDVTPRLLGCLDVLVDGPFEIALKDISLRFHGSSNQRLIDVPKTIAAGGLQTGEVVLWQDEKVFSTHSM